MTFFGTFEFVALEILVFLVLRIKSDPMEKESVRKYIADAKGPADAAPTNTSTHTNSANSSAED
jgi:hypothetical protein